MNPTDTTGKRLVSMLRQAAEIQSQRMGFAIGRSVSRRRSVLIVELPLPEARLAEAAISGGADAILITPRGSSSEVDSEVTQANGGRRQTPIGLVFEGGLQLSALRSLAENGVDFVVARAEEAPPGFLGLTLGKGVAIDHDLPPLLARSLNDLEVDFVVLGTLGSSQRSASPSLRQMMGLRVLSESLRKPLVLSTSYLGEVDDLEQVGKIGIDALLVHAGAVGESVERTTTVVGEYRRALDTLADSERSRRRRSEVIPTIPRVTGSVAMESEPSEPEEE